MVHKKILGLVLVLGMAFCFPLLGQDSDSEPDDASLVSNPHRLSSGRFTQSFLPGDLEAFQAMGGLTQMAQAMDEADDQAQVHPATASYYSHLHPDQAAHYFPLKGGPVRVLSLNGGGIRGMAEAVFLAKIEAETGKRIWELYDVISGTSTGAILAMALTIKKPGTDAPYTAQEALKIYEEMGPEIFKRSTYDRLSHAGGLFGAEYDPNHRENAFVRYFGTARLSEALTHLVIPAYDLMTRKVVVFKTRHAKANPCDDYDVVDVLMGTSAAPTYFPPAEISSHGEEPNTIHAIDGGICANNPGLFSYVEARRLYPGPRDMLLVSLGTGASTKSIPVEKAQKWGNLQWIRPLIDCMMGGQDDATNYLLNSRLNRSKTHPNYYYFNPHLVNANDSLDDVSPANIQGLKTDSKAMLDSRSRDIQEVCERLLKGLGTPDPFAHPVHYSGVSGASHPLRRYQRLSLSRNPSPTHTSDVDEGVQTDEEELRAYSSAPVVGASMLLAVPPRPSSRALSEF